MLVHKAAGREAFPAAKYCNTLYNTAILYYTILYNTAILYYTILYNTAILYYTILYNTAINNFPEAKLQKAAEIHWVQKCS